MRHRRTQTVLVIPRMLQTILFPIVVGLGTILGRYRGTGRVARRGALALPACLSEMFDAMLSDYALSATNRSGP
jgi:hypothetical protein